MASSLNVASFMLRQRGEEVTLKKVTKVLDDFEVKSNFEESKFKAVVDFDGFKKTYAGTPKAENDVSLLAKKILQYGDLVTCSDGNTYKIVIISNYTNKSNFFEYFGKQEKRI